jgi:hypothetical protein
MQTRAHAGSDAATAHIQEQESSLKFQVVRVVHPACLKLDQN